MQSLAINEYESWINMLLGMLNESEYKDYAWRIKEVKTI
jgi:hypothetical protein